MKKTTRLFTGLLVPLALAGTCLATPALALAEVPTGLGAQAGAAAADTVSYSGLSMTVPAGFTAQMDGNSVVIANGAGTVSVCIYDMRGVVVPPDTDLAEFFGQIMALVDETGTVSYAGAEVIAGIECHGFNVSADGIDYLEVFVPLPEGDYTLVEVAWKSGEVSQDELAVVGDMLGSIELSAAGTAPAGNPGQAAEGNVVAFAGLTMQLPEGYSNVAIPAGAMPLSTDGAVAAYANSSESLAMFIVDMRSIPCPKDDDLRISMFDTVKDTLTAAYNGATAEYLGTEELSGGLVGYGYNLALPMNGSEHNILLVFIPMPEGGMDILYVAYDPAQAAGAEFNELLEALETVAPGETGNIADLGLADMIDVPDVFAGDLGFTFNVPEGFTKIGDNVLVSNDAACYVMGAGSIADSSYLNSADVFDGVAAELGGELVGTASIDAVNTTVDYALVSAELTDSGILNGECYVITALVPVANGNVSLLIIMCTADAAETYDAALAQMISSITVS